MLDTAKLPRHLDNIFVPTIHYSYLVLIFLRHRYARTRNICMVGERIVQCYFLPFSAGHGFKTVGQSILLETLKAQKPQRAPPRPPPSAATAVKTATGRS